TSNSSARLRVCPLRSPTSSPWARCPMKPRHHRWDQRLSPRRRRSRINNSQRRVEAEGGEGVAVSQREHRGGTLPRLLPPSDGGRAQRGDPWSLWAEAERVQGEAEGAVVWRQASRGEVGGVSLRAQLGEGKES